jgi:DNA-binding beta-propeller fold protein YncE
MRRLFLIIGVGIVLILSAVLTGMSQVARAQSDAIRLDYTSNNTDTNEITTKKPIQSYVFDGTQGDVISILMVRSSGTLRPLIALWDPRQPKDQEVIAQSNMSEDGKVAGIIRFELPDDGEYIIFATREDITKGKTTGKYLITLVVAGEDATPTRAPRATATKRPVRATPTPTEEEPPAETEEATPENSGEAVQTFEVGQFPITCLWNGSNLFVTNAGDATLTILDGDGNNVKTVEVGGLPGWMAWDGKRLWVADLGTSDQPGNSVNLFDAKGKKVGTFEVGIEPYSLSYDADNQRMWIALYTDKKVISVDAKGEILSSVDTDFNPNTVLWTGDKLWVTLAGDWENPNNTIIALDTDSNIIDTFKVGKAPADLAWDDEDKILFVANSQDNNVMALNEDGKVVGTYKVGKEPAALAWDGEHLWVSLKGDQAVVALSNKGKVLKRFPMNFAPYGLSYDGSQYVWVANEGTSEAPGNTVTRIDVAAALSSQ